MDKLSIIFFSLLGVFIAFMVHRAYLLLHYGGHRNPPPYRRVLNRVRDDNTEYITLECGHMLQLTYHTRSLFPCESCLIDKLESEKQKGAEK